VEGEAALLLGPRRAKHVTIRSMLVSHAYFNQHSKFQPKVTRYKPSPYSGQNLEKKHKKYIASDHDWSDIYTWLLSPSTWPHDTVCLIDRFVEEMKRVL